MRRAPDVLRRAARASRRRRRRPGCRPAPSRSCSPGASPSSRARPARRRARPRRRRRGPEAPLPITSTSKLAAPAPPRRGLYLRLANLMPCSLTRCGKPAGTQQIAVGAAPGSPRAWRGAGSPGCRRAARRQRRPRGRSSSGTPKSRRPLEAAEQRELPRRARPRRRRSPSPKRATAVRHERAVELERRRQAERVHRAVRQRRSVPPSACAIACAEREPGERERVAGVRRAAQELLARVAVVRRRRARAAAHRAISGAPASACSSPSALWPCT